MVLLKGGILSQPHEEIRPEQVDHAVIHLRSDLSVPLVAFDLDPGIMMAPRHAIRLGEVIGCEISDSIFRKAYEFLEGHALGEALDGVGIIMEITVAQLDGGHYFRQVGGREVVQSAMPGAVDEHGRGC